MTTDTKTATHTPGPAYAASYLVNGDASGLTAEEKAEVDLYFTGLDVIDVARDDAGQARDPWFSWNCDLFGAVLPGGELIDYLVVESATEAEGRS